MKKTLKTLCLMTLTLSLGATAEDMCREQASSLGSKNGAKRVSKQCVEEARNFAANRAGYLSMNGMKDTVAFGHKNYILVDKGRGKLSYIGGKMTGINLVQGVAVSPDGTEVAILNSTSEGNQQVLIFSMSLLGNVVPKKIISHEVIDKISSISFSGLGSEIYLLSRIDKKVYAVGKSGDVRSHNPNQAVEASAIFNVADDVKQIESKGSEIIMLTDDNRIRSYSKSGENNWNINLSEKGVSQGQSFEFNQDELEVFDNDGQVRVVRKPASE